jgi:hypothetical protein
MKYRILVMSTSLLLHKQKAKVEVTNSGKDSSFQPSIRFIGEVPIGRHDMQHNDTFDETIVMKKGFDQTQLAKSKIQQTFN